MSVVTMSTAETNADHYIRLAFPTSSQIIQVAGEAGTWEVGCRADPWYNWQQSNDYSYWGSTTFVDWSKATVYQQGVLIWGTEP
jgi:hypothetical protein